MSAQLWTLAGIVETIEHVRTMDAAYADYMEKMYVNFLPGGKYA